MSGENVTHLTPESINAGLGYCHQLRSRRFIDSMGKKAPGLPKRHPPALLNDEGKRVYQLAKEHLRNEGGPVRTLDGDAEAVRLYLHKLQNSKGTPRRSSSHTCATLQLHRVQKFLAGGKRIIRGLANSGLLDRQNEIVDPKGGQWTTPLPLLWSHKHDQPIGWVREVEAKADGLWITAELAQGLGKADESWRMVEAGLVDSYSIGFQAHAWEPLPGGGKRFTQWTLLEVSIVAVPADPRAKIRRGAAALSKSKRGSVVSIAGHPGAVSLIRARGSR